MFQDKAVPLRHKNKKMANNRHPKNAASGTKAEGSVGLGNENMLLSDPFELSLRAHQFIWGKERWVNDETLRFIRNAFMGFRDEVQDMMVDCLDKYYEEGGPDGEAYLPCLGVEHIDLLLNQMVYKINHGYNRYK